MRTRQSGQGQSLVEFTLVVPFLLVLLLLVSDFGRLFATNITIESAARTAAEVGAVEYAREPEVFANDPLDPLDPEDYARIHRYVWESVCDEAATLPNASPRVGTGECDGLPTVVCIHDGADPYCPNVYNAVSGVPAGCTSLSGATNAQAGAPENRYVEVRICYRFDTIYDIDIPFVGGHLSPLGGDFFVERTRVFSVLDF